MKKTNFMFAPDATGTTGTTSNEPAFNTPASDEQLKTQVIPQPAKVYTSEKLENLRTSLKSLMASISGIENENDQQTALMDAVKIKGEIATELRDLKNADMLAEQELARNARIQLLTDVLNAQAVLLGLPKNATEQARNEANDAFKNAQEICQNALLAKYATSPKSQSVATGNTPTGSKGATGSEIVALHVANLEKGMTPAQSKAAIVEGGHSRGTTGAVVLKWEKEQGLK